MREWSLAFWFYDGIIAVRVARCMLMFFWLVINESLNFRLLLVEGTVEGQPNEKNCSVWSLTDTVTLLPKGLWEPCCLIYCHVSMTRRPKYSIGIASGCVTSDIHSKYGNNGKVQCSDLGVPIFFKLNFFTSWTRGKGSKVFWTLSKCLVL